MHAAGPPVCLSACMCRCLVIFWLSVSLSLSLARSVEAFCFIAPRGRYDPVVACVAAVPSANIGKCWKYVLPIDDLRCLNPRGNRQPRQWVDNGRSRGRKQQVGGHGEGSLLRTRSEVWSGHCIPSLENRPSGVLWCILRSISVADSPPSLK